MNADFKWAQIVKRYGFDLMLLPVNWPLASVLKLSPEWRWSQMTVQRSSSSGATYVSN